MTGKPKSKPKAPKKKLKKPAARRKSAAKALRHDTPVDGPAALAVIGFDPAAVAEQALAQVRRIETIEAAYEGWHELRTQQAAATRQLAEERRQLEQQGEFLVGAVRAARDLTQTPSVDEALALALARAGKGLDQFLVETAARLERAKAGLLERTVALEQAFGAAFTEIREELRARIRRTLVHVRPRLKLMIRALGAEQRILHLGRVGPDEAVLLAWVLTQKLPSRYDFLFDDSTDDATQAPPTLYAEEGIAPANQRPTASQVEALLAGQREVLPIKGTVPFFLPRSPGAPQLTRLVERGPVMEVELAEGEAFRNVLTRDEAERIAGYFLRLKLENRLEIELVNA